MANQLAIFRIGYGVKIAIPVAQVQAFLNVVSTAKVVDDRWVEGHTSNQVFVIDTDRAVTMELVESTLIITQSEYDALTAASKAIPEAAPGA